MSTSYMLHNHLNSKRKYNKYLHMFYFISPQTDIRTKQLVLRNTTVKYNSELLPLSKHIVMSIRQ